MVDPLRMMFVNQTVETHLAMQQVESLICSSTAAGQRLGAHDCISVLSETESCQKLFVIKLVVIANRLLAGVADGIQVRASFDDNVMLIE